MESSKSLRIKDKIRGRENGALRQYQTLRYEKEDKIWASQDEYLKIKSLAKKEFEAENVYIVRDEQALIAEKKEWFPERRAQIKKAKKQFKQVNKEHKQYNLLNMAKTKEFVKNAKEYRLDLFTAEERRVKAEISFKNQVINGKALDAINLQKEISVLSQRERDLKRTIYDNNDYQKVLGTHKLNLTTINKMKNSAKSYKKRPELLEKLEKDIEEIQIRNTGVEAELIKIKEYLHTNLNKEVQKIHSEIAAKNEKVASINEQMKLGNYENHSEKVVQMKNDIQKITEEFNKFSKEFYEYHNKKCAEEDLVSQNKISDLNKELTEIRGEEEKKHNKNIIAIKEKFSLMNRKVFMVNYRKTMKELAAERLVLKNRSLINKSFEVEIQAVKTEIKNIKKTLSKNDVTPGKLTQCNEVLAALLKKRAEAVTAYNAAINEKKLAYKNIKAELKVEIKKIKDDEKVYYRELKGEVKQLKAKVDISSSEAAVLEEKEIAFKVYRKTRSRIRQDDKSRLLLRSDQMERRIFSHMNPAYLYVTPAFFGAFFFTMLPMLFMLIGSLFRIDLTNLMNSTFVGFLNYELAFTKDVEFQKALYQTLIFAFITIVLLTFITIAMAAWLAKNTKLNNITQTMVFTPHIASLLSVSILWIALLNPTGVVNAVLAVFGIQGPSWLIDPSTSLIAVSFVTVWKSIGYYVLIIIAGLQAIPPYVYEAAKLDKAKKSSTFFRITIPLLSPTLVFTFVVRFISCFKVFATIEVMTGGGPMGSSMVLSYWIYKVGRLGYNYGLAMAGAVVLTAMIGTATFVQYRFLNKKITYQ